MNWYGANATVSKKSVSSSGERTFNFVFVLPTQLSAQILYYRELGEHFVLEKGRTKEKSTHLPFDFLPLKLRARHKVEMRKLCNSHK